MLDIRNKCQPRRKESLNPFEWHRQYRQSRAAGAVADWLHNLAIYSANGFQTFDEQWFWKEYEGLSADFPQTDFKHYRHAYERRFTELSGKQK